MIKKGDFVDIDYIGRLKENNLIFDITNAEEAKKNNVYNEKIKYGGKIICVGNNLLVKGIDEFLEGKECKKYTLELPPEKAFGKKDPKLMKLISMSLFKKQNIKPFPGLQLSFDGLLGTIKTVSGGRVIIDFNHPLSGKDVVYEINIKRIVTDDKEKINSLLEQIFGKKTDFEFKENKLAIKTDINTALKEVIIKKIKECIPKVKEVEFVTLNKEKKVNTKA